MVELYPLCFQEILRNYRFGNRWIASAFAKQGLPPDHTLAETWEVCDRPNESSIVTNGPLSGSTLHQLIEQYQEQILGTAIVARFGLRFPLLIKFLDASNVLGEQVHHDDVLAKRRGLEDPGKTEAWYMLKVKDGATIHCGNKPAVTEQEVLSALLTGSIRSCMQEHAVQPGDAFLLYGGTMHYSRGGALFYEIMQNSDVIIGLRKPDERLPVEERGKKAREALEGIHLEERMDCRTRPISLVEGEIKRTFALACQHFALERLDLGAPYRFDFDDQRFYVLSQIEGESTIAWGEHRQRLTLGKSCLIPACLPSIVIEPAGHASLLKAYVPDLAKDIIEPLRRRGIHDDDIVALGGQTTLSPLSRMIQC
jgi:mannose-6-phosphate isomerase